METGGCPHAAIREDVTSNLAALEALTADGTVEPRPEILLCESGGDNLAANFSRELADYTIYVIDVAGGDKALRRAPLAPPFRRAHFCDGSDLVVPRASAQVPRKGGPGITQSDLLVVNKIDLAAAVGADLNVMKSDAKRMRGEGPTIFSAVKSGVGLEDIESHIVSAWRAAASS